MATIEKSNSGIVENNSMTLTIRLIMQGKEVGSIIGKKGEIVKRFRDESGAKINISDGSCPERIVTVAGHTEAIYKAFALICNKFEEDLANLVSPNTVPRPPITFRLIVPASQCGSLIGKGGSKIKEIREISGASVQVASEMLPNSTERAVTISGGADSITQCVYHICNVMSESPPKGITVPYRPIKPVTVAAGLGAASAALQAGQATFLPATTAGQNAAAINPAALVPVTQAGKLGSIPLSGLSTLNGLAGFTNGAINPAALAALASQQQQQQNRTPTAAATAAQQQTHEMTVPNELIGCIIGKGGSKIAEIRQLSGAMIRISNCEERESGSNMDRTITITGNAESVALAQYLINMSMDLQKANLLEAQTKAFPNATPSTTTTLLNYPNPLLQPSYFLAVAPSLKPDIINPNPHYPLGLDLASTLTAATASSRNNSSSSSSSSSSSTYQVIPKLKSPSCNSVHHHQQQIGNNGSSSAAAAAGLLTALTQTGGPIRIRSDKFTPY